METLKVLVYLKLETKNPVRVFLNAPKNFTGFPCWMITIYILHIDITKNVQDRYLVLVYAMDNNDMYAYMILIFTIISNQGETKNT